MSTLALEFMFPDVTPSESWEAVDDERGWRLTRWNLPTEQPTPEQLAAAEASAEFQTWLKARETAAKVQQIKAAAGVEITARFPVTKQLNALAESVEAIATVLGVLDRIDALPISQEQKDVIVAGLQMKKEIKAIRDASDAAEEALNGGELLLTDDPASTNPKR